MITSTRALSHRDRAVLRAIRAGRCQVSGRYLGCGGLPGFPLRRFGLVAVIDSCLLTSESLEHPGDAAGVLQIFEPGVYQAAGR